VVVVSEKNVVANFLRAGSAVEDRAKIDAALLEPFRGRLSEVGENRAQVAPVELALGLGAAEREKGRNKIDQ
jgi:hypothetical protein